MFLILLLLIATPFSSNHNAVCGAPQWPYMHWRPVKGIATTTTASELTQTETPINVKRQNSYDLYEWWLNKQSTDGTEANLMDYSDQVISKNWWEEKLPYAPWTKSTSAPSTATTRRNAMSEKVVADPTMKRRPQPKGAAGAAGATGATGPGKVKSDGMDEYYAWKYSHATTKGGMRNPSFPWFTYLFSLV